MFYFLLLSLSAVSSWLLVVPGYFPYLGIGVFFIALSSLVFFLKKERKLDQLLLYVLTLLFSLFIFCKANTFLVLLNTIAVIYFGCILILSGKDDKIFYNFLVSPFITFFQSLRIKNAYKVETASYLKLDRFNLKKLSDLILSIFITFLILLVIIPLLSYSNPFFNKLVADLFNIFNLQRLIKILFKENFFIYLIRFLLFFVFAFFVPRILTLANASLERLSIKGLTLPINRLLIPKVVTGVVLAIFFITQAQLYFATEEVLVKLGYSYSQYAREVFAHLSIVTLIIFSLIYSDQSKDYRSKLSTYLLIIETFFLNLIALKSVNDYSSYWGFTQKRLYGYTTVVWTFGALSLFLHKYFQELKNSVFIRQTLFWSGFILLAVNIFNFDYLIYHYAKSTTQDGIDHYYLSRLSTDSQSYQEHIQQLISEIEKSDKVDLKKIQAAWILLNKIENLKSKYKNLDFRTANLSEYFEYLKIQNLNVETYKSILNSRQFLPLTPLSPILKTK